VGMGGEPYSRFNYIVVHYDQGMKTAVLRIVVICERESEICMQPAMIGGASLLSLSNFKLHFHKLYKLWIDSKYGPCD